MSKEISRIIEVIRTSFLRATIYETLFFTPSRVIVARICVTGAEPVFTDHWYTLIGGIILQLLTSKHKERRAKERKEKYPKLPPEDILKDDKHNYAISNSEITKVELLYSPRTGGKPRPREIEITTGKKKRKWSIRPSTDPLEDYENILRPIFGDKFYTTDQPIKVKKPVLTWNIAPVFVTLLHIFVTLLAFAVWLSTTIFTGLWEFQRMGYLGGDWYMHSFIWTIFIGLPMRARTYEKPPFKKKNQLPV